MGKQKVSGNALKHGLRAQKGLNPEEKRDFEALARDLTAEYRPATATEWLMGERIAMGMTKLRRLQQVEDAMYAKARWEVANPIVPHSRGLVPKLVAESTMPLIKILDILARYQTSLERQVSRAIGEMIVIKARTQLAASTKAMSIPNDGLNI